MILHQELNHSEKVHQAAPHRDFELVIHVGYPKTATTWFQETVLKDPASGFLVPWDNALGFAMDAFSLVNSFHDDANWARSFFEEGLRRCAGKPGIPIISQEALTGQPLNRQYNARYVADRLRAAFPRAKILIGIREQKSFAVSLYRMYIKLLGAFPLEIFLGRGDEPPGFAPILRPDYLEYDRVVGYYQELYGRENVLVMPIEFLRKDPRAYLQSIIEFCQCPGRIEQPAGPEYVGMSAMALELQRWLNLLFPLSPLNPPSRTLGQRAVGKLVRLIDRHAPKSSSAPLERRWKAIAAQRYDGMYRDSNRRLAELTDIDLAALGYEL